MPFFAELVKEQASNKPLDTPVAFNLGGAETGFRTIVAGIATGQQAIFRAYEIDADGNPAGAWEIFSGLVTDATPDTLARSYLIDSSTGSWIDWSGTGVDASPMIELTAMGDSTVGEGSTFQTTDTAFGHHDANDYHPSQYLTVPAINILTANPIFIPYPILLKRFRCRVNQDGDSGQEFRICLYDSDHTMLPDVLVANSENLDVGVGSAGTTWVEDSTDLDVFVKPGLYWMAGHAEVSQGNMWGVRTTDTNKGASSTFWLPHDDSNFGYPQSHIQSETKTFSSGAPATWGSTYTRGVFQRPPLRMTLEFLI